jgi:hypothetical protein
MYGTRVQCSRDGRTRDVGDASIHAGRHPPREGSEHRPSAWMASSTIAPAPRARQRARVAPLEMLQGKPLPRCRGERAAQRIGISGFRDGGEAGRKKRLERGWAPALGHDAIESLIDLLSNPDQRRETTARGSGHDLAKGNGPRGLECRPRRCRTRTIACRLDRAQPKPGARQTNPGLCKSPTGHAVRRASVGRWHPASPCRDCRTDCSVSATRYRGN